MGQTIEQLENALLAWEDLFRVHEARVRIGLQTGLRKPEELVGPVRHWRELRNHLLSLRGGDFDYDRFCHREEGTGLTTGIARQLIPAKHLDKIDEVLGELYQSLPLQLASWTISSRRVFNLNEDMVQRFLEADYSHYTWSDLLWPFDAFFIQLETPVKESDGFEFSGLLISSVYDVCPSHPMGSKEGFECLPFHTLLHGRTLRQEFMDEKERERFEDDLRHKRWIKLNRRVQKFMLGMSGMSHQQSIEVFDRLASGQDLGSVEVHPQELPAGSVNPLCWEKTDPIRSDGFGSPMGKIIAGLCLYLEALPPGVADAYSWRHTSAPTGLKRELRKIVTDGAQVCEVADLHTISPETMTLFPQTLREGPAYAVTPHWRRGHMRRRPGHGNDPNAPRDVEVKPAHIHKDQLPIGAVSGGAISKVR